MTKHVAPVGFLGEKVYQDVYDRTIYYLDIAGILPDHRASGLTRLLARHSLKDTLSNHCETIFVSRTQTMLIAMTDKIKPNNVSIAPLWTKPNSILSESINWFLNTGKISKNNRADSSFEATDSLIHWGAYGEKGSGTSWEDMTTGYDIDWSTRTAKLMSEYLTRHGSSIDEMLTKGHALIISAHIPKNYLTK